MSYKVQYQIVDPERYLFLRKECGLSAKTLDAAKIGMQHSVCSVAVTDELTDEVIGMGRIIGDGACHCQIVDICVLPAHQKKGLGKLIMDKLDDFIKNELPEKCYISLIADGEAYRLYEHFGFKEVWPASRGMAKNN